MPLNHIHIWQVTPQPTSWWRHQLETFSALLAICAGNSPVPGEFPTQRPVTRRFDFSLICARINGWVNNREAGDLRRHRAHYDVIVMCVDTWYRIDDTVEKGNQRNRRNWLVWHQAIIFTIADLLLIGPCSYIYTWFGPLQQFSVSLNPSATFLHIKKINWNMSSEK